jgi:hypothetical protein
VNDAGVARVAWCVLRIAVLDRDFWALRAADNLLGDNVVAILPNRRNQTAFDAA